MLRLRDLQIGMRVRGLIPNQVVTIVNVARHDDAVTVFYQRENGDPGSRLLLVKHEANLELLSNLRPWNLDIEPGVLRVASEAYRIQLAHLFDPRLAVHTSLIEPLPHQITAVYGEMLSRQPLRFLLADDPGAGKTIMAGLLIKELMVRGDVRRCLICAPGSLTEQWQEELWRKFQLRFEILSRERIEASYSGNPFVDEDQLIIRLDQVSRDDELRERLQLTDWDLVICDEAHKMSASFFGNELKETKRYRLGKLLGTIARHYLLMTATPHNGKEEDFQLFMALLDPDRFEGRFREGVYPADTSDLMRRMVKEDLRRFDGRMLFPERKAYTVDYELSAEERDLYEAVTEYVRDEFNRAESLQNGGRRGTVGFAMTVLQRRLASSPEAIYQSLHRRRVRLEKRLKEARLEQAKAQEMRLSDAVDLDVDDLTELEDYPDEDLENLEIELADSATAAQTIAELEAEIMTLGALEVHARRLRTMGTDRKWEQLAEVMQSEFMFKEGSRRKIVIFTEHRDTLLYLERRLSTLLGSTEGIVAIHGGIRRSERMEVQDRFRNDPDVYVLLATDAAGEGINLQRAHLMVNYDLPWNPNRLEQRFGRIHRIGQEEVCHLWNLVAGQTREGHVYRRLLEKLENARGSLDGKVFDVLGKLFAERPLREMLVEAIRYGDSPDVRSKLEQAVDSAVDRDRIRGLLEQHSLAETRMDVTQIEQVREEMERAAARRLQPYHIKAFFLEAFERLGGTIHERESGRYQINHVPEVVRKTATELRGRGKLQRQYERICFEKNLINLQGKPMAEFVCPGHLLLDTVIELIRRRYGDALQAGAVLIDPLDAGQEPRTLYYLEHAIQDGSATPVTLSTVMKFVEVNSQGEIYPAGDAPYLDYRSPTEDERALLDQQLNLIGIVDDERVQNYVISQLVPQHLEQVERRRFDLIERTVDAVHARLTKEIHYWDARAVRFKEDMHAGKRNARVNWQRAEQRAAELVERKKQRLEELEEQRQVIPMPPVIVGRALIIPAGLLDPSPTEDVLDRRITEQIAMRAVMEAEIALGNHPVDVSKQNAGYDIESRDGRTGRLRFIEVKGRRAGADSVTITRNEVLTALNKPDQFILALVEVENGRAKPPRYVHQPPFGEPGPNSTGTLESWQKLIGMSVEPR